MQQTANSKKQLPPGPKGIFRNLRKRIVGYPGFLAELYEEYGDIVYFELPRAKFCIVYSPELIEEVLVTRQDEFPTVSFSEHIDLVEYTALTGQNGTEHHRKRFVMDSAFSPDRMKVYSEVILEEARLLRERLTSGKTVDIQNEAANYAWASMVRCFLGREVDFPYAAGKTIVAYARFQMLLQFLPASRLLARIPFPVAVVGLRNLKLLDGLIYDAVRKAKEDSSHDGHDVVSHFVRAKDQGIVDWTFENDRMIRDEMIVLHAYVDAPIGALALAFYYIALNPGVRERLEKEVDQVTAGAPVKVADFARLPYTRAFCSELLRFDPPTYVSLPRPIEKDLELGGYFVPKGTMLHTGSKVVQRRAEYWDDPHEFRPDRWLKDAPRACPSSTHSYVPFGAGPHSCVGGEFATRMIVYCVATLLQRRRLDPRKRKIPEVSNIGATVLGKTLFSVTERQ